MKNPVNYYRYHPLPAGSIRLMKLHYTESKTTIDTRCLPHYPLEQQLIVSLETFLLKECPFYIALSYTWGLPGTFADPNPSVFTQVERVFPIYCDDTIILGTWNLRCALRRIRRLMEFQSNSSSIEDLTAGTTERILDGTHYLWVDSICINQNDQNERAIHVRAMGKVYSQAYGTLVWLGVSDEFTLDSFAALERVMQNHDHASETAKAGTASRAEPVMLDATELKACLALFNRKWFQRNWITQEVALSNKVWAMIGEKLVDFGMFARATTLLQLVNYKTSHYYAKIDFDGMDYMEVHVYAEQAAQNLRFLGSLYTSRGMMRRGQLPDFTSVIIMCKGQKCLDPRDKIYSILPVCVEFSESSAGYLVPNYTADVDETYFQATKTIIRIRQDLLVLNLTPQYILGRNLPSFCPDYRFIPPKINTAPKVWKFGARYAPVTRVVGSRLVVSGQCIGRMKEHALYRALAYRASEGSPWNLTGLTPICSLLVQLSTDMRTEFRCQLDLMANSAAPYPIWLFDMAGLHGDTNLPSGVALLLPTILRTMLMLHLAQTTHFQGFHAICYGVALETCLSQIRRLEPDNVFFLPLSGEVERICRAFTRSQAEAWEIVLLTNIQDQTLWASHAAILGLDLPQSLTGQLKTRLFHFGSLINSPVEGAAQWQAALVETLSLLPDHEFFRTDNHLFGYALCKINVGDQLWILDGAFAPFFLRPLPNGNFIYVGQTWMHGLMNGEAVRLCRDPVSILIE